MASPIDDLLQALAVVQPADLPTLSATLDLRPSPGGGPPAAPVLARDRLRQEFDQLGERSNALVSHVERHTAALEEAIAVATEEGAHGLVFFGTPDGDPIVASTTLSIRNSLRLRALPWVFEVERYAYLHGQRVVVILADTHTTQLWEIEAGDAERAGGTDHEQRYLREPRGRGINWNNIPGSVLAHRLAFAKEAASEIAGQVRADDVVILAGVPEARIQLIRALPDALAARIVESTTPFDAGEPAIVAEAAAVAVTARRHAAATTVAEVLSGAAGDLGIAGADPVLMRLERGQVAGVVLQDDAVRHSGDSDDARLREGVLDDDRVEALIRGARGSSAALQFTDDPRLLAEAEGVAARLRWV